MSMTRLPAFPLITNDPYLSIWSAADRPTDAETTHWAGDQKPLRGKAVIDGTAYRFLGLGEEAPLETTDIRVTPTSTQYTLEGAGVRVTLRFTAPLLLSDPDVLSMPVSYIDLTAESADGRAHEVSLRFDVSDKLCFNGETRPEIQSDGYRAFGLSIVYAGQKYQKLLCHSADHITIDWGYAYLAAIDGVQYADECLRGEKSGAIEADKPLSYSLLLAYDDVASINYFGRLCRAWYARNGATILDAIRTFDERRDELMAACRALDDQLEADALKKGGENYREIVCAAYRHSICAHKLIADENGEMVFLSKENDSNGCIGTVDVSYPSIPLYLLYNPEFVRAMCRPVLRFAQLPVWTYDFAPHDVGRYPHVTGQVYGARSRANYRVGDGLYPPFYLYPASADVYAFESQMPVEECGNMLIMLAAAAQADGDDRLAREYMPLLTRWVKYLVEFGEDPGEQLCTDDFAGHLAHNVNLSAKAIMGVAAYALLQKRAGDADLAAQMMDKAREMAKSWLARADLPEGSCLTFDGKGWSMKYNLVWDKVLGLNLLPEDFYRRETRSYLPRIRTYGLPLDSREDYTKSDWILWTAAMTDEQEVFDALVAPVAKYLRETPSRVPFSDWYFTTKGNYRAFIARSVQGGLFMPLLAEKWKK